MELEEFHNRLRLKKAVTDLVARHLQDDLYIVEGGKSQSQLREVYGYSEGKSQDLFLWHEEVIYAQGKGLLCKPNIEVKVGEKRKRTELEYTCRVEIAAFYSD